MIKIVVEDYVQHISGYRFKLVYDPEIIFGDGLQYQNRISLEFNFAYHWHPLIPSVMKVGESEYAEKDLLWNADLVLKHGFKTFVDSMVKQSAGRVSRLDNVILNVTVIFLSTENFLLFC